MDHKSKYEIRLYNKYISNVPHYLNRLPLLCEWEGNPENIVYQYPYVVAFEPQFIEVRHVDTVS